MYINSTAVVAAIVSRDQYRRFSISSSDFLRDITSRAAGTFSSYSLTVNRGPSVNTRCIYRVNFLTPLITDWTPFETKLIYRNKTQQVRSS